MIIKLKDSEVDKIMEIWLQTTIESHYFIDEKYWIDNYELVKNEYIPNSKTFVYKEENIIRGFISIINECYIGALFVLKDYQGKGVGKGLIDYCKSQYEELELSVYVENKDAVRFYKKQVFKIVKEEKNENQNFDEYKMVWR